MRCIKIRQNRFSDQLSFMHQKRLAGLWLAVEALSYGGRLWLTGLGRDLKGNALEKHRIKQIDRLLGNEHLQKEMKKIYSVIICWLLKRANNPIVLVDWTGVGANHVQLTASISFDGRSIPIYNRVCKKKGKGQRVRLQKELLSELSELFPSKFCPVIVTDAGFYTSWFNQVVKQNWHFIGRIRNHHHIKYNGVWETVQSLLQYAGKRARSLGKLIINCTRPNTYRFVLSGRPKPKGRKSYTRDRSRKRGKTYDINFSRSAKEPLLLATSLNCSAKEIVKYYSYRMQIEESFRDFKNRPWLVS